ncbi:MAG TPA: DALR domain-containing protein, partial [Bacteroidia bacterium]|nr:DALR domain-containing protein [Bacteroidia bacterium]
QALQDAEKALAKLSEAFILLQAMEWKEGASVNPAIEKEIAGFEQECRDAMNDDFNTAIVIANMFKASSRINQFNASGKIETGKQVFEDFKKAFSAFYSDILGLVPEQASATGGRDFTDLIDNLIHARDKAKADKDFKLADTLRNIILQFGELKDSAQGAIFKYERKK